MENPEKQSRVLSQQPPRCHSKSPHSIDCSVKNPAPLPEKTSVNMSVKTPALLPNDLDIGEGTILGNFYKVEKFLGQGVFGYVTKCINTKTNKAVAVKVNKNKPNILRQAKLEMFMLEQLRRLDPDSCNIVRWNGYFLDRERICLNFELLDQSLYDYMEDRNFQALPISELRPVLHQLANALAHLSSMGIVHTDLKIHNLMTVDRHQSPMKVKIIDFGLARLVSSLTPDVTVQPTCYRAPEVMIHAPFNEAIDMWSLGLIAVELAIAYTLYNGETEIDVFRFITLTQGQPPDHVLDRGFSTDKFFVQEDSSNRRWRFKSVQEFQLETGYQVQDTRGVKLRNLDALEDAMEMISGQHSGQDLLVSLIKQMLHLDSLKRIKPLEVLKHPFFDLGLSQSSSRDPRTDMENPEKQSHVLSQQPPCCHSKSPHSIDCSVKNPAPLPEKIPVKPPALLPNDLDIGEGTILGNSYKVEKFLGQGVFGYVTKCINTKTNKAVAVKVNKNKPNILRQAKLEMFMLEQLRCLDPDSCNIVRWNGYFLDRERICLNFELLDQSLYDYTKDHNFQALPISELRPVLHQLANALAHLSSMGIVHTDLKTDNLMIVDRHQSPMKVKIIDFGMARLVSSLTPDVTVQPTCYRAPEVMLHAPFNEAIDMWSLGLIAAELAIGRPLYPGKTETDVFRFITLTQGQPPDHVLDRGFSTDRFFVQEDSGNRRWRFKSVQEFKLETGYQVRDTRGVKLRNLDALEDVMKMISGQHSGQDLLVSLIKQMLHLDSLKRIKPLEVLKHPFFDLGLSQSSSRDPRTDMENPEKQSRVLSQQAPRCHSKSPHSIDCSVKNPAPLPEKIPVKPPALLPNDLDIGEGTILGNSYKVEKFLGQGVFGYVTKCINTKTNKAVAVKVNKNKPNILRQAKLEMFMLEQLRRLDPDSCNIVRWNGYFLDRERICLNFELLNQSLYDYMKDRNFQALPISELRPVLHQLANALAHLSSMGIVHTDLKTDNLMNVDRQQSPMKVKIIDFGLARLVSSLTPDVTVQPTCYRAPEVMLHAPFNEAIDMWSLGLIAAKLAIGRPLYPGKTETDVFRFITLTQGQPPDHVLDRGFSTDRFFVQEDSGNRRWRFKSVQEFKLETGYQVRDTRGVKLRNLDALEGVMKMRSGQHSGQDLLVSLIKQMLHLDSLKRIKPLEVLKHPFFDLGLSQSSSRDPRTDMENPEKQSRVLSQQPP